MYVRRKGIYGPAGSLQCMVKQQKLCLTLKTLPYFFPHSVYMTCTPYIQIDGLRDLVAGYCKSDSWPPATWIAWAGDGCTASKRASRRQERTCVNTSGKLPVSHAPAGPAYWSYISGLLLRHLLKAAFQPHDRQTPAGALVKGITWDLPELIPPDGMIAIHKTLQESERLSSSSGRQYPRNWKEKPKEYCNEQVGKEIILSATAALPSAQESRRRRLFSRMRGVKA